MLAVSSRAILCDVVIAREQLIVKPSDFCGEMNRFRILQETIEQFFSFPG